MSVCLIQYLASESLMLRVWSLSEPKLCTTPLGTTVRANAAIQLAPGAEDTPGLYFETVRPTRQTH